MIEGVTSESRIRLDDILQGRIEDDFELLAGDAILVPEEVQ